ncbi:MAG: hypothetical protein FJX54_18815 [Alphaproteobacteria bacterium]|nr:hypothetical protein [Alphaproteobacteria bacterium]
MNGANASPHLRRKVRRKRRVIIDQRLRQLIPTIPALVAELFLLDQLMARNIELLEWAAIHVVISLVLFAWAKWIGRRIRRNQLAWYLFVATAGLGPIGPFAALATGLFLLAFHRDWFDFNAWYQSLFPTETRSRVTDLYESLLRRQRAQGGSKAGVESFADILSGSDSAKKRLAIGLLTRHFRPGFSLALKLALTDSDPSVRTQAATAVATIEGRFLARAQILQRKARERPKSFGRRYRLARHYDDYAFTGLLDTERERDNRIRALASYEEALKVKPRETGIWLAIGRLLVRERRYDAAASWFMVAEARGLLTPDMILWNLEALFRLGRYDKLREAIATHKDVFKTAKKLPPQVSDVIGLWTSGSLKREAA